MRLLKIGAYAYFPSARVSGSKRLEIPPFSSWGINRVHGLNLTALSLFQSSHQDLEVKRPAEAGLPVCQTAGHQSLRACERRGGPRGLTQCPSTEQDYVSDGASASAPSSLNPGLAQWRSRRAQPGCLSFVRTWPMQLSCSVPQFPHL